jgi:PPK2 family polyphosphate:nucleotide phosphotransferase
MSKHRSPLTLTGERVSLQKLGDHPSAPDKATYESRLASLQRDMLRIQRAYFRERRRALLVFEGWDAAGKGGAIRRLTGELDPRGFRVFPIGVPSPSEQGRHYLFRFWQHVPSPGMFTIFDRSHYGRVLVERVEGLIGETVWRRAYQEINEFERLLADDGVRIVKCFLHITQDEQLKRFRERLKNPDKRWKLTVDDIRNRERWPAYETAIEDMLAETATEVAPWHLVLANHKWHARLAVLESAVARLGEGIDYPAEPVNPEVLREAEERLGISLEIDK